MRGQGAGRGEGSSPFLFARLVDIITRHLYLVSRRLQSIQERNCLSSSFIPERWWQSGSQGWGQRRGHWSTSPTPTPGLAGSGAAELGEITGDPGHLKASLFHKLIRCLSQCPTLYLPGPTPRQGEGPSPPKRLCLEPSASRLQKNLQ